MRRSFYLCLVLKLVCISSINAQSNFNKVYFHDGNSSRANAIIQTKDSGYLFVGPDMSVDYSSIVKVNSKGDTLWTILKNLGIGGGDLAETSIELKDSCYLVGGMIRNISVSYSESFLMKISPQGKIIWSQKYGDQFSERCYSVKQTSDSGFIFTGWRYNASGSESDIILVKTDNAGNKQWEKTFGGTKYDFGKEVLILKDGGYMIFGTTYSYGVGLYSMYLIKTDSLGNMLWEKTYGGTSKDYGHSIIETSEGNYALAGNTYINTDTMAAYVLKVDTAGVVLWQKKYKGALKEAEFTSIKELLDGELIVCGHIQKDTLNYRYHGMLKNLSSDGDLIWEKEYTYFKMDSTQHYFFSMDLTKDKGFVMAGMVIDYHHGANPTNGMWVVKTDSLGCDTSLCFSVSIKENSTVNDEIKLFPNPFSSQLNFNIIEIENAELILDIIEISTGRIILSGKINSSNSTLSTEELMSGVYMARVKRMDRVLYHQKVICIK